MSEDLLVGPSSKIRRAQRHLAELEECIQVFLRNDACSIEVEEDRDSGSHVLRIVTSKPLPEDIPLAIGDAANNLRSALDILVSAFIRKAGGNIAAGSLPIHETKESLAAALQRSEINKVRPDVAEFILNNIKPYKDGNFGIWALSKLDNVNKHRLIIPVVAVTRLSGISARDENNNVFTNLTVTVDHGRIMNLIQTGARMHITNPGHPAIAILFDEGHPFEGNAVVPTLHQLINLVAEVVESFRSIAP